ncbi:MAG: exodeoxyribonuclease VII large subunit [Succinivibrio sp.]
MVESFLPVLSVPAQLIFIDEWQMLKDFVTITDERLDSSVSDTLVNSKESIALDIQNAMTVSEYLNVTNNAIKRFGTAVVIGEISELKRYNHLYFKIKDEFSYVDCLMWSSQVSMLSFTPQVGQKVVIVGESSVYTKTGQFRLIANTMKQAGLGLIMEQLRLLKEKLTQEGVFSYHKRTIPRFINTVGVITSAEGRVLHDIKTTMQCRNPGVNIRLYPALVQGPDAAVSLIEALRLANEENCCEVLIIGRGGGSFEDLLPFSDETLVRAVARSSIPVISAVGHEPDYALTDFAADLRAPTPTGAAQLVTTVTKDDLNSAIDGYLKDLNNQISTLFDTYSLKIDSLTKSLKASSPEAHISKTKSDLNYALSSMDRALESLINNKSQIVSRYLQKLSNYEPSVLIAISKNSISQLAKRMDDALQLSYQTIGQRLDYRARVLSLNIRIDGVLNTLISELNDKVNRISDCDIPYRLSSVNTNFNSLLSKLEGLNPLYILKNGYSVTFDETGRSICAHDAHEGQKISTMLKDGKIVSKVISVTVNQDESE